jgi:hypothetical protein
MAIVLVVADHVRSGAIVIYCADEVRSDFRPGLRRGLGAIVAVMLAGSVPVEV